ncbi:threonine synthase [Altererythrobacter sp. B11]|uniref:SURF1 family protein n=1 Tax=Altererythrobacter sp. B11 TaxID=2060312 RepID=UPI000DC6F708|nr:SURF1 family protein [Altererythrobacter sp. B11]BBC72274.1 threonine synthase [Altererythrobacter sp. B11]
MIRRLPVFPTLLVSMAVAAMIALGVWQLHRKEWKEALLARYSAALTEPAPVAWPRDPARYEDVLYRRSTFTCERVLARDAIAGRSEQGQPGWAQTARCALAGGGEGTVALGWGQDIETREWPGGPVSGFIAPAGEDIRLVAAPAQAGLAQLARPDPNDLPNNHLSYAVQWFFFAATAIAIYVLALRRRQQGG